MDAVTILLLGAIGGALVAIFGLGRQRTQIMIMPLEPELQRSGCAGPGLGMVLLALLIVGIVVSAGR